MKKEEKDAKAWAKKCKKDARAARWSERVEEKHLELLHSGHFIPRLMCFHYLLGKHALEAKETSE
jgi:hypothetical protein